MPAIGAATAFLLKPADEGRIVRVFLSSGTDLNPQRDLFRRMIDATNAQFREWGDRTRPWHIVVEDWKDHVSGRPVATVNDLFIKQALRCDATLVMFAKDLRPGTLGELEAVLPVDDIQLSVIWMKAERQRGTAKMKEVLADCREGELLLYEVAGPPGSESSVIALLKVIQAIVADLTKHESREEAMFLEVR